MSELLRWIWHWVRQPEAITFAIIGVPMTLLIVWTMTYEPDFEAACGRLDRLNTAFEACMNEPGCTYTAADRAEHERRLRSFEAHCKENQ